MKSSYIYILTNKRNGTLYVGVTSDLAKRVWQHKNRIFEGFTARYGLDRLVYYEVFSDIKDAIAREKQLKRYLRQWKIDLIQKNNPEWLDLYESIV